MPGTSDTRRRRGRIGALRAVSPSFARYVDAQSNHLTTFSRSTSLSAQGVDKSVELHGAGVQSLGTQTWRASAGRIGYPGPMVLSHPEVTLCPPVLSRPDLHRDAAVHTFHRPYVDDFLVIPELHKLFSRPVQAPDSPETHPATVTTGRRPERKHP